MPVNASEQARASLYDRLGRIYPIAIVIDDFIQHKRVSAIIRSRDRLGRAIGEAQ
jgi:uncharacterized protein (DUF58 family)